MTAPKNAAELELLEARTDADLRNLIAAGADDDELFARAYQHELELCRDRGARGSDQG